MRIWLRLLVAAAAVTLLVIAAWGLAPVQDPITQPISYNHNLHVEEEGLECIDCHLTVEEATFATIPNLPVCLDCHDTEPLSESPEEQKLIAHIEADERISWNRIYTIPGHVYFSHRRHVTLGELECATCHGNVAEITEPQEAPNTPLTMEWCMDCHVEKQVTNDCLSCHR